MKFGGIENLQKTESKSRPIPALTGAQNAIESMVQEKVGGSARGERRTSERRDAGFWDALEGIGQRLWQRWQGDGDRRWRTDSTAQGAVHRVARSNVDTLIALALTLDQQFHHAGARADHLHSLRIDHRRSRCHADKQGKPDQREAGDQV